MLALFGACTERLHFPKFSFMRTSTSASHSARMSSPVIPMSTPPSPTYVAMSAAGRKTTATGRSPHSAMSSRSCLRYSIPEPDNNSFTWGTSDVTHAACAVYHRMHVIRPRSGRGFSPSLVVEPTLLRHPEQELLGQFVVQFASRDVRLQVAPCTLSVCGQIMCSDASASSCNSDDPCAQRGAQGAVSPCRIRRWSSRCCDCVHISTQSTTSRSAFAYACVMLLRWTLHDLCYWNGAARSCPARLPHGN